MDNLTSEKPNDRLQEISFEDPDPGTGGSGGKSAGSAPAREVSFEDPDPGTGGSGGKSAGSAPAREH